MRIRLETGGGYAGLVQVVDVDAAELGGVDVAAAVESLAAQPATPPAPAGLLPRYRLTVETDGESRHVELVEPHVPAAVRPLIAELLARRGRPGG